MKLSYLFASTFALLPLTFACPSCTNKNENITFDHALIPSILTSLPSFTLGGPIAFSNELLNGLIADISPLAILSNTTDCGKGKIIRIGERAIGWVDKDTGATTFVPTYEELGPIDKPLSVENLTLVNSQDLFPDDDTIKHIVAGPLLYQRQHHFNQSNDPIAALRLQHFSVERLIQYRNTNFTIRGPGSKAVVGVNGSGTVLGVNYLWHRAQQHSLIEPVSVESVYNSILSELGSVARNGRVNVTSVEVTYYDSAKGFIQPVFTFLARKIGNSGNGTNMSIGIQGYIPLGGRELEPLPSLQPGKLTAPDTPNPNKKPPSLLRSLIPRSFGLNKRIPTVTVGRYVYRNADDGFHTNAQQFGDTLIGYSGSAANFVFSQYYWAYNWLYTTYMSQFANAVNILLTEAHGNWHVFATSPDLDWVRINSGTTLDIPETGYGGGSGGTLAYWIIHACEVIPTETDYPGQQYQSFSYWWSIFNGLHAVMGFRTEGLFGDGVTIPFAKAIGQGVGVVPAWMSAALAAGEYNSGWTYQDGNRDNLVEPYGRPSSVSVCGHTDDLVWDIENLGRPGCLWEWWYEN